MKKKPGSEPQAHQPLNNIKRKEKELTEEIKCQLFYFIFWFAFSG